MAATEVSSPAGAGPKIVETSSSKATTVRRSEVPRNRTNRIAASWPAVHRAGAVEHEGDVDGGAPHRRLAGDGDEDPDLMRGLGGVEPGGQLDVGLHA
jgi:hypothetical protein